MPAQIIEAFRKESTQLRWQDQQALYVHVSLLNELPPVLRAYVACAESLYGDASQADLVKLHKSSGKVTFLLYDDFIGKPLPQLRLRVKVNLRTRWTQIFDHSGDSQLLCWKERFVHPQHPDRGRMEETSSS
jgi:DNA phosphorothioation-associated putative methyltransferase